MSFKISNWASKQYFFAYWDKILRVVTVMFAQLSHLSNCWHYLLLSVQPFKSLLCQRMYSCCHLMVFLITRWVTILVCYMNQFHNFLSIIRSSWVLSLVFLMIYQLHILIQFLIGYSYSLTFVFLIFLLKFPRNKIRDRKSVV